VLIHSMIDNKPLALSLGAIDVMPKPVDSKALLLLVRRICTDDDQFVLLVDSNKEYSQVLRTQLERQGFKARVANTGEEALKELKDAIPAMILLDVSMSGMDGFQVMRELNENPAWRRIPLVVLSNKELTELERKKIDSNIRQYLNKQKSNQDAISSTIRRILKPA
jgi:CheY-like chemotaxis protein